MIKVTQNCYCTAWRGQEYLRHCRKCILSWYSCVCVKKIFEMTRRWRLIRGIAVQYPVYCIIFFIHFIRCTLLVPGWTPFCFQNYLNSPWHRFNKMLETFFWDVHIDMIVSSICCRYVGCTSMMWIFLLPHSKYALLDWDLLTVEGIRVQWTHCHVQEISSFERCDVVLYHAGRRHQKMDTLWS